MVKPAAVYRPCRRLDAVRRGWSGCWSLFLLLLSFSRCRRGPCARSYCLFSGSSFNKLSDHCCQTPPMGRPLYVFQGQHKALLWRRFTSPLLL